MHIMVVSIRIFVYLNHMMVYGADIALVEDAQHLFEPVVDASVQEWNLHDDALVGQTPDERAGMLRLHQVPIVVLNIVIDVDDGYIDVLHFVPE